MNACLLIGRRETGFKKSYKKRQAASESSDQQRGFLFPLVEQRVSDAAHVVHHHRRAPRNGGRSFRIVVRPHATGTGHRDDRHLRGHEAHRVDVGRAARDERRRGTGAHGASGRAREQTVSILLHRVHARARARAVARPAHTCRRPHVDRLNGPARGEQRRRDSPPRLCVHADTAPCAPRRCPPTVLQYCASARAHARASLQQRTHTCAQRRAAAPGDAAGAGEADGGDGLLRRVSVGVVGEHGGDGAELRAHDTPPHSVPARPRHPAACTHTRPPAGKLPCAPALRPQRCPPAESSALPHHGHSPKCPARRRRRAVLTHAAAYHRDELLDCSAG